MAICSVSITVLRTSTGELISWNIHGPRRLIVRSGVPALFTATVNCNQWAPPGGIGRASLTFQAVNLLPLNNAWARTALETLFFAKTAPGTEIVHLGSSLSQYPCTM